MKEQDDLELHLDKTKEKEYWWSRTPEERFQEMERLRRIKYGYKATERIKKVLEIVKYE